MKIETVKVYKGKKVVVCNKTDVEIWNKNGYFTSSQQKKAAETGKSGQSEDIGTVEITEDVVEENGEDQPTEESTNPVADSPEDETIEENTEAQTEQDKE